MKIRYFVPLFFLLISSFAFSQTANKMTLLANWDDNNLPSQWGLTYNEIWGWADTSNGREYAIMGSLERTYFFDITNPSAPYVCDSVEGKYNVCVHRDYKTYGKYCYAVADEGNTTSTLQIMDMSYLPDSVHVVYDSDSFFNRSHNIFIDQPAGRLYVVGSPTQGNGCILLDIATDPENPVLLSSLNLGQYAHDLYVRNDTVYFNCGNKGLYVYDYTNPTSPQLIAVMSTYVEKGYNHSCWLNEPGTHLVMADETHNKAIKIVDVTNMSNLNVVSTFKSTLLAPADTTSIPHNPLVAGNYAVVSYYHDGVQIYDISNPANPVSWAWYDTDNYSTTYAGYEGAWGVYPFLPSGTIIASDVRRGLFVLRANFPFPYDMQVGVSTGYANCMGTASATASGGTPPYSYLWSNGDTTSMASGLNAGTHFVNVYDRYGNTIADTFVIAAPAALSGSLSPQSETCSWVSDGTVDLSLSGGTAPFSYLWSNGATTEDISGLVPGTYWVIATDTNGCQFADTAVVGSQNVTPIANAGGNSAVCAYPFSLHALPANVGSGSWSVLLGSANFAQAGSPTSNVSGLSMGVNQLVWTIVNGPCTAADTISLIRYGTTGTYAGPDKQVCSNTAQLSGNFPPSGMGMWTVVSGQGVIAAPTLPSTGVTGMAPGLNSFAWTVTDGPCTVSDTLLWTVDYMPEAGFSTSANALVVQFNDTSSYGTAWSWDFGNGSTSTFQNPTHTYTASGNYTVCQYVTNVCGLDSICRLISVTDVGIAEGEDLWLGIYPNPFGDELRVEWPAAAGQSAGIRMWDAAGRLVLDRKVSGPGTNLATGELQPGIYLLEWLGEKGREVRRIQKMN